jgi:DNA-binding response OmpR family regulator
MASKASYMYPVTLNGQQSLFDHYCSNFQKERGGVVSNSYKVLVSEKFMQKTSQKITIFLSVQDVALCDRVLTWIKEAAFHYEVFDICKAERRLFVRSSQPLVIVDDHTDGDHLNEFLTSMLSEHGEEIPVIVLGMERVSAVIEKLQSKRCFVLPLDVTRSLFLHEILRITRKKEEKLIDDRESLGGASRVMQVVGNYARKLNKKELKLIEGFLETQNKQLTIEQVLALLLNINRENYNKKNLEARICRLRRKLKDAGAPCDCLVAVKNWGYELRV